MSGKVFIDTNVFVYSLSPDEVTKKKIADSLISKHLIDGSAVISYQVVQEFLNVAYKKKLSLFGDPDYIHYLQKVLLPIMIIFPSGALFQKAMDICQRWQLSFYDSLIVASAIEAGCNILFSEDLQHGLKIFQVEVVNPFSS